MSTKVVSGNHFKKINCCSSCLLSRYLDKYEKIHFHGEDPDDDHTEKVDSRGRKVQTPASQVPMVYNHQQHDLTGN